jgi:hypothetical protein
VFNCLKEMRAIIAEESLIEVERLNVGSGFMEKSDTNRILARWRKWAGGHGERQRFDKASPEVLARMGLGNAD